MMKLDIEEATCATSVKEQHSQKPLI